VLRELVHPLPQLVVLLVNSTINISVELTVRRTRSARVPTGHHFSPSDISAQEPEPRRVTGATLEKTL
jgi:hypothetical protein